jgi:pyridoxamine 5'-phosphate oxidase
VVAGNPVLESLGSDPLRAFQDWYTEALDAQVPAADAMTLATATRDGVPSARIVLYKGIEEGKLLFVSNYESKKGTELTHNPFAALVFFWPALNRQVRLEGEVVQASDQRSDRYFAARPRESQLGAWASAQSQVVASRGELERRFAELELGFSGQPVPRPKHWGVYLFTPRRIEFWLGQNARLHDRFSYTRQGDLWQCERLCP